MPADFISCDWGTSSFRLKWVKGSTGKVQAASLHNKGIKSSYNAWQLVADGTSQLEFFLIVLQQNIDRLSQQAGRDLSDLPVVVSGMASSSIGMLELPYADLPLSLAGEGLVTERIARGEHCRHEVLLISGLSKPGDVMRGEEVQCIGWWQLQDQPVANGILILPGTHSKHVKVRNGQIVDFHTYLTGELFEIITRESILKNTIETLPEVWDSAQRAAFAAGVQPAGRQNILNSLFSIRALHLQGDMPGHEAGYFLSGLLIGQELRDLRIGEDCPVILCAPPKFAPLYEYGMQLLSLKERMLLFPPSKVEDLVVAGQRSVLANGA